MKHTFQFDYEAEHELKIGDVYYTVESNKNSYQQFKSKCPVCQDNGFVILNNERYACPRCQKLKGDSLNPNVVLTVYEQKVYKWTLENISYGESQSAPLITVKFGRERTHPFDDETDYFATEIFSHTNKLEFEAFFQGKLYKDYEEAVSIATAFNKSKELLVNEYNDKHGTDFKYKHPQINGD